MGGRASTTMEGVILSRKRISLTTLTAALGMAAALLVAPPAATGAPVHDPIVFVHGYDSSASTWDTMVGRFKADGWTDAELTRKTYSSTVSNKTVAQDVGAEVDRVLAATGATQVDIVTHSMGGLSSRWFLKHLDGTGRVDDWVSLGGPNHGTNVAYLCFSVPCGEMRPGSAFLTELNQADETPGAVDYGTWWSPCDEAIDPQESTILAGATNTKTACMAHSTLLSDATVYGQVRDFVVN